VVGLRGVHDRGTQAPPSLPPSLPPFLSPSFPASVPSISPPSLLETLHPRVETVAYAIKRGRKAKIGEDKREEVRKKSKDRKCLDVPCRAPGPPPSLPPSLPTIDSTLAHRHPLLMHVALPLQSVGVGGNGW